MPERKVYVTRYWQTEGIRIYTVDDRGPHPAGQIWLRAPGGPRLVDATDCVPTLDAAQARVKDKADRLRVSLSCSNVAPKRRSQLQRLEIIARDGARVTEVGS